MTTEEIKEILDKLDFNEWEVDLYKVPITWCELYDIRDYITNLQQEINKLTAESTEWESKYYDLQSRCEKAIEYIEKEHEWIKNIGYKLLKTEDLLNILNGVDEK